MSALTPAAIDHAVTAILVPPLVVPAPLPLDPHARDLLREAWLAGSTSTSTWPEPK